MTHQTSDLTATAALEQARGALAKLPILGPALWLLARDPVRKYLFLADMDWAVLPPVVLDQCRLFTRRGLPYAFVPWALVNDAVHARLRSVQSRLAPHEWQTGEHVWIIDPVAPFGQLTQSLDTLRETVFAGREVHALLADPAQPGALRVCRWPPAGPAVRH